jgi:Rrf2 family protein
VLNRKTTYGIRALTSIARASPRRLSVAELAKSEGIPRKFLAVILLDLAQHGIVQGRRGRVGGYELAVDPNKLTVAEVVESLGGPVFPIVCLRQEPGRVPLRCEECPGAGLCPAKLALCSANREVRRVLSSISLSDLVHEVDGLGPFRELPGTRASQHPPDALGRERRQGGSRLR